MSRLSWQGQLCRDIVFDPAHAKSLDEEATGIWVIALANLEAMVGGDV